MLKRIVDWSIENRFFVLLATAFAVAWGVWAVLNTPLDAIPDLSDVQVIVYTEYPGQAPQVVEDQVTYPLTTALLAVPKAKVVRGLSMFGVSFIYVIFEDGTDIYWARSRVLEYLNFASGKLPRGVTPSLGPDATGVGWVFQYTVEGKGHDLGELRSIQDWYIRYALAKVPGVSEVASVGGFGKQYQVTIDPARLVGYNVPLSEVIQAIKMGNNDVGGRTLELTETEYMIRGQGYIRKVADLENTVIRVDKGGIPIRIRDVARVQIGPDERRGILEKNGEGEAVGGIVVMRYGENALQVIDRVKEEIARIAESLPPGVSIVTAYDRSDLIRRAVATLREKLVEESLVVALVCVVFLLHFRSALVAILMLPVALLISFGVVQALKINANIMSLGGFAIAIGAMIDGAIVMIENAHKHIDREGAGSDRWRLVSAAAQEVGPPLFYSLLIITVSFMPVFTLEAQEGRLFAPLAYTKTFAMAAAALLSITLVPVLMGYFIRGKIRPEHANPVTRFLIWLYGPVIERVLRFKKTTLIVAVAATILSVYPLSRLGWEFMPELDEGSFLFMPVTFPGLSVTKAGELLQLQDRIIKQVPEVESVIGKAGRAMTATDPAPLEMFETVVNLKPRSEWRPGMTKEKLRDEMWKAVDVPGVSQAWTQPIKARIDMLATGIRTPVGIKLFGDDLATLGRLALEVEQAVKQVPGTASVFAERITGGYYLDIEILRDEAARYGLMVSDIQDVIGSAIGGENITWTVERRERYPISVRYARELRDDVQKIGRVLVPTPRGEQIPLAQVARIALRQGPPGVRSENARLTGWIFVDVRGRDIGSYVREAQEAVRRTVKLPPRTDLKWSGQYEYMERAFKRLAVIGPVTLVIIFFLLYMNFRNVTEALIVMLSLPFALVGGVWIMFLLGYDLSVAVGVGFIALAGVAAETGVVMLIYLDYAYEKRGGDRAIPSVASLADAIREGAVDRVRPKMMTVTAIMAGLLPIMWGSGTGSEVMRRIAAPMVGGMVSSTILTLVVIPVIYAMWKEWVIGKRESEKR